MAKEGKYGEETKMLSFRVPVSLVSEITQTVKLRLLDAEKSNVLNGDFEKKSNPADVIFTKTTSDSYNEDKVKSLLIDEVGQYVKPTRPKFTPNATKNEVNMDSLRSIANGENIKSELFATKKKPIDEEYDCIEVTRGIPDILDRVYASTKSQIAFWDRDDNTVFYVLWESKYYRFVNSGQFNKFLKDNNIK